MPELTPIGIPEDIETAGLPEDGGILSPVPDQEGILGSGLNSDFGKVMFEDYFPKLDLSEEDEEPIIQWFERDLRSSIKNVNKNRYRWATYRAVYMLEYIEKFYPDMGVGADYSSGLLCEKTLEGMDRLKRSIFSARPYFGPDVKETGSDEDVNFYFRAMWCLHTYLDKTKIAEIIGDAGAFDYIVDGSLIVEADTMYEKIPQRTLKTYTDMESLADDEGKAIDSTRYDEALLEMQTNGITRLLIEEDVVTKSGLQFFHVDKVDHLIPENVYEDRGIRFRARRMYLTSSDLRVLSSDGVNWYEKSKVDEVTNSRTAARGFRDMGEKPLPVMDKLKKMESNYDLFYDWHSEDDSLKGDVQSQPYEDVYAIYRITCKYGYRTKSDPDGVIPKYCVFDYSPEGRVILRAVTYPHFDERPNWFHFKFGYAPKSYYGFGYGARIIQDDFLESNVVSLFMNGAALATFNPFLCKHPDAGGIYPWVGGFGPGKVGYAMDPVGDFKQVEVKPPSDAMLRHLLPLTKTQSANKTSVTSLVQGRTESSDPRSPARKTAMLLGQASVGLDVMVDDWNRTGWNKLAQFTWMSMFEIATYALDKGADVEDALDGLVVAGDIVEGSDNQVTLEELQRDVVWGSLASTDYLNPEQRMRKFLQLYSFFAPMLRELATFNPDMYKKYFLRWMRRAAQEVDLPGFQFLIPTREEVEQMPADNMAGMLDSLMGQLRSGQNPDQVSQSALGTPQGRGGK